MHELAITSAMLEAVEERAQELGARRIVAINLVLGARSGIVDDALRLAFELLAPGTLAEDAQIRIRRTPLRFHCAGCAAAYAPAGADFRCPRCGVVGQVTDDGSELLIESIEIEP
jgi:hydrogenase nickel incorporation protein HypA/HybF